MTNKPIPSREAITRTAAAAAMAAGAVAIAALGMPTASASPSGDLWSIVNSKHVAAGCAPYADNPVLGNTALDIAKVLANPPGGIAGDGRTPTDSMLAGRGYFASSWAEADYVNSNGNGSPQDAMNFWLNNPTRDIFPNLWDARHGNRRLDSGRQVDRSGADWDTGRHTSTGAGGHPLTGHSRTTRRKAPHRAEVEPRWGLVESKRTARRGSATHLH